MEKHRGVDFFGCRMSFGLVKNGRQCIKADLENREGGLSPYSPDNAFICSAFAAIQL